MHGKCQNRVLNSKRTISLCLGCAFLQTFFVRLGMIHVCSDYRACSWNVLWGLLFQGHGWAIRPQLPPKVKSDKRFAMKQSVAGSSDYIVPIYPKLHIFDKILVLNTVQNPVLSGVTVIVPPTGNRRQVPHDNLHFTWHFQCGPHFTYWNMM